MTFQAYIDTIEKKTGKTPEDFRGLAKAKGLIRPDLKAMEFVNWLKQDFDLGQGHGMAMFELFRRRGWVDVAYSRAKPKAEGKKTAAKKTAAKQAAPKKAAAKKVATKKAAAKRKA